MHINLNRNFTPIQWLPPFGLKSNETGAKRSPMWHVISIVRDPEISKFPYYNKDFSEFQYDSYFVPT